VLLPFVSLHPKPDLSRHVSVADASPSSFELAARLGHPRASRSDGRTASAPVLISAEDVATTTTSTVVVATTAAVVARQAAAAPVPRRSSPPTTAKRRPTTTTTPKKKATTTSTTSAPKPTSPPQMRPWTPPTQESNSGQSEAGEGTWYKTSDPQVCAHKSIPMGTVLKVTNIENGKTTTCKVGDRGPYVEGRIVDLSPEAFSALAPLSEGVINVKLEW
jgi:rare lipoprotein A (peptidoglycan hydrolase)